jgi:hypothetical protein
MQQNVCNAGVNQTFGGYTNRAKSDGLPPIKMVDLRLARPRGARARHENGALGAIVQRLKWT